MTTILPPIPRFVMTKFEPLSLIAGFLGTVYDPTWFVAEQVTFSPPETLSKNSIVVALQLGNLYLLMAMLGIAVLYTTSEPKVVRNYVIALALGDIGHVYICFYVLGYEKFMDLGHYNAMAYGNIVTTCLLFATRVGYLTGLFGPDRVPMSGIKAGKAQ